MNCAKHPEVQATAFCRSCGKALCEACQTKSQGTVYCEEHRPVEAINPVHNPIYARGPEYSPYTAPVTPQSMPPIPMPPARPMLGAGPLPRHAVSVSPGLAFLLGCIPGVGAIYNGQYAKGLMHVVIFGLLISLVSHGAGDLEPLFGMGIGVWFFYMAFEAYHTAKRRMLGIPVDEFSSLVHFDASNGRMPVGPMLLIILGTFFLLANFDLISMQQILRFWPLGLIGFGVYMLLARMKSQPRP